VVEDNLNNTCTDTIKVGYTCGTKVDMNTQGRAMNARAMLWRNPGGSSTGSRGCNRLLGLDKGREECDKDGQEY